MATKKPEKVLPPKKKSPGLAAMLLDTTGWVVREVALPVPDTLINMMKKKKGKNLKKKQGNTSEMRT